MLEKLFTSRVRLRLLQLFLNHQEEHYYQRQLERLLDIGVRSLQLELDNLINIGFLKKENDGNRVYFSVNDVFPLLHELQALILKGSFLVDELKKLLSNNKVRLAFIYGSAAKDDLLMGSDIDLFIVGDIDSPKIHRAIKKLESSFSRTINYVIYDTDDLIKKAKEKAGFVTDVLKGDKIFIKGTEDEFRKIIK